MDAYIGAGTIWTALLRYLLFWIMQSIKFSNIFNKILLEVLYADMTEK